MEKSIDRDNKAQSFSIAVRLILESGQTILAQKLFWTEKFAQTYLNGEAISGVIVHASKNEGSKDERRSVAIELFGGWTKVLAPNQVDLAARMQGYLASTVKEDTSNVFGQAKANARFVAGRVDALEQSVANIPAPSVTAPVPLPKAPLSKR